MSKDIGNKLMQTRKEKELSREELATIIGTSGQIIRRYEHGDMMSSVEIAPKIADALEVSLHFLVGKSTQTVSDKSILARLEDIITLPKTKILELFNVLDAYIRNFKTSKS